MKAKTKKELAIKYLYSLSLLQKQMDDIQKDQIPIFYSQNPKIPYSTLITLVVGSLFARSDNMELYADLLQYYHQQQNFRGKHSFHFTLVAYLYQILIKYRSHNVLGLCVQLLKRKVLFPNDIRIYHEIHFLCEFPDMYHKYQRIQVCYKLLEIPPETEDPLSEIDKRRSFAYINLPVANAIRYDDIDSFQQLTSSVSKKDIQGNYYHEKMIKRSKGQILTSYDISFNTLPWFDRNEMISLDPVTYVQYACFYGSVKCFKFLVANGAQVAEKQESVVSTQEFAVHGGNVEIIHVCQQKGLDFFNEKCLEAAVQFHQTELVEWIMLNIKDKARRNQNRNSGDRNESDNNENENEYNNNGGNEDEYNNNENKNANNDIENVENRNENNNNNNENENVNNNNYENKNENVNIINNNDVNNDDEIIDDKNENFNNQNKENGDTEGVNNALSSMKSDNADMNYNYQLALNFCVTNNAFFIFKKLLSNMEVDEETRDFTKLEKDINFRKLFSLIPNTDGYYDFSGLDMMSVLTPFLGIEGEIDDDDIVGFLNVKCEEEDESESECFALIKQYARLEEHLKVGDEKKFIEDILKVRGRIGEALFVLVAAACQARPGKIEEYAMTVAKFFQSIENHKNEKTIKKNFTSLIQDCLSSEQVNEEEEENQNKTSNNQNIDSNSQNKTANNQNIDSNNQNKTSNNQNIDSNNQNNATNNQNIDSNNQNKTANNQDVDSNSQNEEINENKDSYNQSEDINNNNNNEEEEGGGIENHSPRYVTYDNYNKNSLVCLAVHLVEKGVLLLSEIECIPCMNRVFASGESQRRLRGMLANPVASAILVDDVNLLKKFSPQITTADISESEREFDWSSVISTANGVNWLEYSAFYGSTNCFNYLRDNFFKDPTFSENCAVFAQCSGKEEICRQLKGALCYEGSIAILVQSQRNDLVVKMLNEVSFCLDTVAKYAFFFNNFEVIVYLIESNLIDSVDLIDMMMFCRGFSQDYHIALKLMVNKWNHQFDIKRSRQDLEGNDDRLCSIA